MVLSHILVSNTSNAHKTAKLQIRVDMYVQLGDSRAKRPVELLGYSISTCVYYSTYIVVTEKFLSNIKAAVHLTVYVT